MNALSENTQSMSGEGMVFDYIIVGGGTAGCLLANRLSKDQDTRVLLLEAGDKDSNPLIKIPVGVSALFGHKKLNWRYWTEPELGCKGRKIYWPRGKVLGGSSSINGMIHMRGNPEDFNQWRELGNAGWGWEDVLPYFKKSEHFQGGADEFRGDSGELSVKFFEPNVPISHQFVDSAIARGLARNDDFNGANREGAGIGQVNMENGVRCSSAAAFLRPAQKGPNLKIEVKAFAEHILFKERQACGIEFKNSDGKLTRATCRKEVILSGGSVNSPQLLQLSGIGDPDHLKSLGINLVHALPGVGENLKDHVWVPVTCRVNSRITLNHKLRTWKYPVYLIQYLMTRRGLMTQTSSDTYAFVHSRSESPLPDLQLAFRPYSVSYDGDHRPAVDDFEGCSVSIFLVRPESVGSIKIASADPQVYPTIRANYLTAEADVRALVSGIVWARKIFNEEPIASMIDSEFEPGDGVTEDTGLIDYIRGNVESVYHPVSTCRMGHDDQSVVDDRLRVHGIQGLRVIDASIMPTITSANTNAPTVMIAEKGADLVLADNR